jgi:hypothetical protein
MQMVSQNAKYRGHECCMNAEFYITVLGHTKEEEKSNMCLFDNESNWSISSKHSLASGPTWGIASLRHTSVAYSLWSQFFFLTSRPIGYIERSK